MATPEDPTRRLILAKCIRRITITKQSRYTGKHVGGGKKMMNEIIFLMGNIGFPLVVTIFFLVKTEGKFENLSGSISGLSRVIRLQLK